MIKANNSLNMSLSITPTGPDTPSIDDRYEGVEFGSDKWMLAHTRHVAETAVAMISTGVPDGYHPTSLDAPHQIEKLGLTDTNGDCFSGASIHLGNVFQSGQPIGPVRVMGVDLREELDSFSPVGKQGFQFQIGTQTAATFAEMLAIANSMDE